jgi:hypothetical protein
MDEDLTPAEVEALTGQRRLLRQVAVLARLGVPFRFGGATVSVKRAVARELPQWQARQKTARPRLDLIP